MKVNKNYKSLKENYLFSDIARRVNEYQTENPNADIIRMGIGDVTLPLCGEVIKSLHTAVDEMAEQATFKGYGPEQGYKFLQNAIKDHYAGFGVALAENEIFISDGAKSDLGNILDLFDKDNTVLIPDPVYPVYVDTNIMDGRSIKFLDASEANGFLPMPDDMTDADIIYLCSPNNPTGAAYTRDQLKKWVEHAAKRDAVILFDAAYEAFITDDDIPHSIFEIDGAKSCAIEFCSFSKTAGFTGTRCGYTVIPKELERDGMNINKMWLRRQTTKFNGTSYIVQRGAAAVFTPEGMNEIRRNIDYYRENARIIADALEELGIFYTGGKNSPYIWLKCPDAMDSWEFFDLMLKKANVVGTPGSGFGENGSSFFRLTAFSDRDSTKEAMRRMKKILGDR